MLFFGRNFLHFFNGFELRKEFCVLLFPYRIFLKKFVKLILALFANLKAKIGRRKTYFINVSNCLLLEKRRIVSKTEDLMLHLIYLAKVTCSSFTSFHSAWSKERYAYIRRWNIVLAGANFFLLSSSYLVQLPLTHLGWHSDNRSPFFTLSVFLLLVKQLYVRL